MCGEVCGCRRCGLIGLVLPSQWVRRLVTATSFGHRWRGICFGFADCRSEFGMEYGSRSQPHLECRWLARSRNGRSGATIRTDRSIACGRLSGTGFLRTTPRTTGSLCRIWLAFRRIVTIKSMFMVIQSRSFPNTYCWRRGVSERAEWSTLLA